MLTQLAGRELANLWELDNPMGVLKAVIQHQNGHADVESRSFSRSFVHYFSERLQIAMGNWTSHSDGVLHGWRVQRQEAYRKM